MTAKKRTTNMVSYLVVTHVVGNARFTVQEPEEYQPTYQLHIPFKEETWKLISEILVRAALRQHAKKMGTLKSKPHE